MHVLWYIGYIANYLVGTESVVAVAIYYLSNKYSTRVDQLHYIIHLYICSYMYIMFILHINLHTHTHTHTHMRYIVVYSSSFKMAVNKSINQRRRYANIRDIGTVQDIGTGQARYWYRSRYWHRSCSILAQVKVPFYCVDRLNLPIYVPNQHSCRSFFMSRRQVSLGGDLAMSVIESKL